MEYIYASIALLVVATGYIIAVRKSCEASGSRKKRRIKR